ncbi:hypothetical protein LPN01_16980 [Sphingomonas sp. A2-49]|uniref:hypothetical protein n=1 Tax=Sphingomonas sp. A2-49 TaxID=1391375 RepID=UPI0021CFBAC9|nr:hypothetical protein [Sphingomonas sp. A2-49]MCU6455776.1 hypothetical protein [Sphingomonas sp. A2-49]
MTADTHPATTTRPGGYVVRGPRATDTLGHALRNAFGCTHMPEDIAVLVRRLDRVAH